MVCLPTSPSSSSLGTNVAILSNIIKSQPASTNLSITVKHSCKCSGCEINNSSLLSSSFCSSLQMIASPSASAAISYACSISINAQIPSFF